MSPKPVSAVHALITSRKPQTMQTRSQTKKSSRDDSPVRKHVVRADDAAVRKQTDEAVNTLKRIEDAHGAYAVDLTARLFYYHVHISGQYRVSLPSKDSALAYIKRLVHKHDPDEEPVLDESRDCITYTGDALGVIQAMNLPPHLAHLFPKPLVLPGPCAGGECDTIVVPCLDEECSTVGCDKLLCQDCFSKKTCVQHARN